MRQKDKGMEIEESHKCVFTGRDKKKLIVSRQPTFLTNLKSNTMKTMQKYGGLRFHANKARKKERKPHFFLISPPSLTR